MAKRKPQKAIAVGPVSAFWMPARDKLLSAGFRAGNNAECYIWESASGGDSAHYGGRFWLYVWLKIKTSEIFIHHVNKPRAAQNPALTTVGTGAEFTALIERYGWQRPAPTQ